MIQPKDELIRDAKISGIKKQVAECINAAFSKGYETCFEQKKEIEDRAYQRGLEDGRRQGEAIDGDKRYWDGYHAAQEDVKKIYQKGLDDAWEVARKLTHPRYDGYRDDDKKKIFGFIESDLVLMKMSASEAIEKIRAYEEKQKQEEAKERFKEKLESGYFSGKQKQATFFPDSPCDLCVYNPPSSGGWKPCTMCPAEGKVEE